MVKQNPGYAGFEPTTSSFARVTTPVTLTNPFSARKCTPREFGCNDGRCVPMEARCNEVTHCDDLSDEIDCAMLDFKSDQVGQILITHEGPNFKALAQSLKTQCHYFYKYF